MVSCVSCLLQEKGLINRYAEATAENTQRQKQMGLAKNLILQVRKQVTSSVQILFSIKLFKVSQNHLTTYCNPTN